jgi:hypothetical protein
MLIKINNKLPKRFFSPTIKKKKKARVGRKGGGESTGRWIPGWMGQGLGIGPGARSALSEGGDQPHP